MYAIKNLPADASVLLWGQILSGMSPLDAPVSDSRNDPMMPVAWTREHTWPSGKKSRVVTTTMGAATDLLSEGLRRLLVNGVYWGLELEDEIRPDSDVSIVGSYRPTDFGFGDAIKGRRPADYR